MEWLLLPIDVSRAHLIPDNIAWHGRLMVIAWSVIFPSGVLIARFMKISPKQDWPNQLDNLTWWHSHWILQSLGGIAVVAALWLIWGMGDEGAPVLSAVGIHHLMGWTVAGFCVLQFLAGWLRGSKGGPTHPAKDGSIHGDHYDMTPRRLAFEYLHKYLGYFALLASWVTTLLGLWVANAPVWMFLILSIWYVVLVALFVKLQRMGLAFDTYQAIWGPDPDLPGNQRKPIGFGIHRRAG